MPTTLVVPSDIQVFFYYVFHVIFLGHPADILARLWLAHDLAHPVVLQPGQDEGATIRLAWKNFEDSIRESYRTVGVSAGLVAAITSLFFSVSTDISNTTVRTLLLASVTTAVLSAASSFALLSTVLPDPAAIEDRWEESGLGFVLSLSGPSAWLSLSLWTFQAALLALVWITDETPAQVVVTFLLSLNLLMRVTVATSATGFREFCQGLLGRRHGANHRMIKLNKVSIILRKDFLRWSNKQFIKRNVSRSTTSESNREDKTLETNITIVTSLTGPEPNRGGSQTQLRGQDGRQQIWINPGAIRSARFLAAMPDDEHAMEANASTTMTVPAATG